MSVSVWQQPLEAKGIFECDAAVIGAGIIGAYTAYKLAESGRKVALLEARFPAAGASGRNAGMCLMGAADNYATGVERFGREKARLLWHMTKENGRKMRQLIQQFGTPYIPCGSAILAIDREESRLLENAYALMREDGFEVEFSQLDPFERGFGSAVLQPDDFGLDPAALVTALIENASSGKVKLFNPAEVFAINRGNQGKLEVEAKGIKVVCEQIALCTNAFSPLISPYFVGKVDPVRGQILVTAPLSRRVLDKLAYANYGYEYFRQLPNGAFLLGGGRSRHRELEVGYDEVPTSWLQATLEEFLQVYFPDVASSVPVVRRWAGIMGFSCDGLPLAGQLPEIPGQFSPIDSPFYPAKPFLAASQAPQPLRSTGIYFAVGFTGHGMGWGLITADAMLCLMDGSQEYAGIFDARRLTPNNMS